MKGTAHEKENRGFTMLEFLVAMAVFLLVAGAAFSLFFQQSTSSAKVQGRVALNMALRNASTQIQMDMANAGSGYFQNANIPSWPVGVTIVNNVVNAGTSCYNAGNLTYTANCFDVLNIISAADSAAVPPVNATDSTGGTNPSTNCSNTSTGTAYGRAATGLTLAQTAANFRKLDQVLFVNSTGTKITTAVLTQGAKVSGNAVQFNFNATNADGSNSLANDPLDISACDGKQPCTAGNKLGVQFCANDWVIRLSPITYQVNSANPADPILTRTQNGATANVMDQIIGFKIGASIWNASNSTLSTQYIYDASTYTNQTANDMAYNFTLVRAVRVSVIGRTQPSTDANFKFRNGFDQGPYQVQGTTLIVNPRNMSMND
jgi:prepilin-type N-terminal cleavage/methylation domain-containing protein